MCCLLFVKRPDELNCTPQRAPHFPPGLGGLPPPPVPGSEAAGPPFFPGVTGQFGVKQEEAGMTGLHRPAENKENIAQRKEAHIKKPLNAFMLYMKEMRPVVQVFGIRTSSCLYCEFISFITFCNVQHGQAECTLKESAAINQILGRRWHGLSRYVLHCMSLFSCLAPNSRSPRHLIACREEQAKYYEKAREERQRHMQVSVALHILLCIIVLSSCIPTGTPGTTTATATRRSASGRRPMTRPQTLRSAGLDTAWSRSCVLRTLCPIVGNCSLYEALWLA